MTDAKKPLDQAVELAVFAPIGIALEAKRLLPTFVERGRTQVQVAKLLGQLAVAHGKNEATKKLGDLQGQAGAFAAELGLGGTPTRSATDEAAERVADASIVAPTPIRSSAAAATLTIADYDSLAASQVIPRLAGLAPAELEAVRTYELAHRGRKTILGKITQLTGE